MYGRCPVVPYISLHGGIYLTGVGSGRGSPSGWRALPEVGRRVSVVVPNRWGLPGLPGVAAVARRVRLRTLRVEGGWRIGEAGGVRGLPCANLRNGGHDLDRTRTPLTVWFTACWQFASGKDGVSALSLQRTLEIGSYQTAWAMMHRLRSVLVRPGRGLLVGIVEVDETFIGGQEPGLRGGRARGKKVLTGVAVEVSEPKGIGRCRMALLLDASAHSSSLRHGSRATGRDGGHQRVEGLPGLDELGTATKRAANALPGPAGRTRGTAARGSPGRVPG